jgi:hypothetical protein
VSFPDPTPDLITPLREGPPLWRFDGARLIPGVAPPSEQASALLARTTTPWWPHPVAAYDQALPLGELSAEDLVASLVHPPARPDRYGDLADDWWVRAAQAFACLGLLHCRGLAGANPSGASPDNGSARRLLTQLAFGVEDWVTEAALFGLAVAAWADPACRAEVADTVTRRYLEAYVATQQHVVTILPGLAALVLIVPGVGEQARTYARDVLAADDEPEPEPV